MKVHWEMSDIQGGRKAYLPGQVLPKGERCDSAVMIGYNDYVPPSTPERKMRYIIAVSDGSILRQSLDPGELAKWLNDGGYLPVELRA